MQRALILGAAGVALGAMVGRRTTSYDFRGKLGRRARADLNQP